MIIVGPALTQGGTSPNKENVKGDVMAFDVRTGKKLWVFHTIPRKGEPGYETWLNGSAEYTGNTGLWGPFSADEELGYVYLATESPTNDGYGGHRPGANLFSDSLVCLDIKTGKMIWYKQLIHHDIWDYDMPVHPILIDIKVDGGPIKAVVQMGKMALAYVLDRTNGRPVWPIPDVPVPQTDVPTEWTSPTQPIPTKPPAFDVVGVREDDLITFSADLRNEALRATEGYRMGAPFAPPSQDQGADLQSPLFGVGERREDGRRSEGVCRNERHSLNSERLQKTIEFEAKQRSRRRSEGALDLTWRSCTSILRGRQTGIADPGANLKES